MSWSIYKDLLVYAKATGEAYLGTSIAAVAKAIEPAATGFLVLYIMFWGLASIMGEIDAPLRETIKRVIKISLIFCVGIQLGRYNILITKFFMDTPGEIATKLTGAATSSSSMDTLDTIFGQGFTIAKAFWEKGGILDGDVGNYILAFVVLAITIGVTLYSCFLIIMAMMLLYILISAGSIFIISLMFKATENFFSSWIAQLSNYSILMLLVYMINIFIVTLFSRAATGAAGAAQVDDIIPFVVMGLITILTLKQLPNPASGLAGGIALSSEGAGRMALRLVTGGIKNTVKPAARAASWAGKKAARKAWSSAAAMRNNSVSKS